MLSHAVAAAQGARVRPEGSQRSETGVQYFPGGEARKYSVHGLRATRGLELTPLTTTTCAFVFVCKSEVLMQGRRPRQSAWLTRCLHNHSHHHPARATQSSRHAASHHASTRAPTPTPPGRPPLRRHPNLRCHPNLRVASVLLLTVPRSLRP